MIRIAVWIERGNQLQTHIPYRARGPRVTVTTGANGVIQPGGEFFVDPGSRVTLTITATAGENGGMTPAGVVAVDQGSDVTFVFAPNAGKAHKLKGSLDSGSHRQEDFGGASISENIVFSPERKGLICFLSPSFAKRFDLSAHRKWGFRGI